MGKDNGNDLRTFEEFEDYVARYPLAFYDVKWLKSYMEKFPDRKSDAFRLFQRYGCSEETQDTLLEVLAEQHGGGHLCRVDDRIFPGLMLSVLNAFE